MVFLILTWNRGFHWHPKSELVQEGGASFRSANLRAIYANLLNTASELSVPQNEPAF